MTASTTGRHLLGGLIEAGAKWLLARGVEDAWQSCRWLAAHSLGIPVLELPLEKDRVLSEEQVDALREGVVRLGRHEPIQYVIGEWDFRGLRLKTDRRALIPRPETEQLVQLVLDETSIWEDNPLVCDVGTGGGCIVVSLAMKKPEGRFLAIDTQAEALSLARENAERLELASRIEFVLGHSCEPAQPGSLDAVVSNPPYIESEACGRLGRHIGDFEPLSALDGGEDGLLIVRDIVFDAALRLKPGGWCFLEIGHRQGHEVRSLMYRAGFSAVRVLRDLSGRDRFVKARI